MSARGPSLSPTVGSLSFRICLFFAANPDECLTTRDIAEKFEAQGATVFYAIRRATNDGWFRKEGEGQGHPNTYFPGPRLLEALGRSA